MGDSWILIFVLSSLALEIQATGRWQEKAKQWHFLEERSLRGHSGILSLAPSSLHNNIQILQPKNSASGKTRRACFPGWVQGRQILLSPCDVCSKDQAVWVPPLWTFSWFRWLNQGPRGQMEGVCQWQTQNRKRRKVEGEERQLQMQTIVGAGALPAGPLWILALLSGQLGLGAPHGVRKAHPPLWSLLTQLLELKDCWPKTGMNYAHLLNHEPSPKYFLLTVKSQVYFLKNLSSGANSNQVWIRYFLSWLVWHKTRQNKIFWRNKWIFYRIFSLC